MFQKLFWLSIAGACGTVSRFVVCEAAQKARTWHIPLGTLSVNILGSFFFGLVYVLAQRRLGVNSEMRVILLTGFMGAFTTFSTFAFETAKLFKSEQWMLGFGNILAHTGLGLVALAAGVFVARMF